MKKNSANAASVRAAAWDQYVKQTLRRTTPAADVALNDALNKSMSNFVLEKEKHVPSAAFEKLVSKPLSISIELASPQVVFLITDLPEDPTKLEEDFREFLAKTFQEDLTISFRRNSGGLSVFDSAPIIPPTILPSKIKWNMAAFSSEESNGKWIVTIKVPLF